MKTVLITGASRGIGAATAQLFADKGYSVLINYRSDDAAAQSVRDKIVAAGGDAHCFRADVGSAAQVQDMFERIGAYFRKIDVLVNNAGIALTSQLQDVTERQFDEVFAVNCKGAFFCCKYALPLLRRSEHGAIVNVSSIWGRHGASCESVYSMTKHAVVGLTRSLAQELAPQIRVNCVCPPIVATDMCAHLSPLDVADFSARYGAKLYTPQQVAEDIYKLSVGNCTGKIIMEK